jgi:hypothetical protein
MNIKKIDYISPHISLFYYENNKIMKYEEIYNLFFYFIMEIGDMPLFLVQF